MLIFLGCDISFYLTDTFTFEIFLHKPFIIHLEVILHILQSCIIVTYHQIGIFTHNMHLLNFLLVKLAQHSVVILLITQFAIFDTADIHSVIKH